MTNAYEVAPPRTESEIDGAAALIGQVFTIADGVPGARTWFERAGGPQHVRIAASAGRVVGALIGLPLGQWFGGRSVPMIGVAGVATAPESRGRGAAQALMAGCLRDYRAAGWPIASLYPATQDLYRRVGYERAGVKLRAGIPVRAIASASRTVRDVGVEMRRATDADAPAIERCATERARGSAGLLDRSAYIWSRVRNGVNGAALTYVVEGDAGIEGYVCYVHRQTPSFVPDLWATDLVAITPRAAARLLAFFSDHRSLAGELAWNCGPGDPLLFALPEQRDVKVELHATWMTRILDVSAAFAARGWPAGLSVELHLDVADALFPENCGPVVVRISGGRAEVVRGGTGALRCDIRGLAALFTGHLSPADAVACGALAGPRDDVMAAAAAFAGPAPWLADHF